MGLLDFLSPALTVGTEAAGAQQQAQLQSALMKRQQEIQAILLEKQLQMQQAQIKHLGAQDVNLGNQYDPTVRGAVAGAEAAAQVRPKVEEQTQISENTGATARNKAEAQHAANEDNPTLQGQLAGAKAGAASNATFANNAELARIRALSNPMAQTQLARLSQAAGMAQDADQSMRRYEQVLATKPISTIDAGLAKAMLHGSVIAETALNQSNPDLAEYVRNAKAMSTAERMIAQRGGSNYLTQAEQTLSGVGAGAGPNIIAQAQKYRHRIVESVARESTLGNAGISPTLFPQDGSQPPKGGNFFLTP